MPNNKHNDYSSLCDALTREAAKCELRISQTLENQKKEASYKNQIIIFTNILSQVDGAISKLKTVIEDITEYTTARRAESTNAIKMALMSSGNIVPSSNQGIKFKMESGEAWFETADELSLDRTEGSGYRSTLSMFMRHVFLRSNQKFLQTLILDEILAKLSPERSAVLSTYLPILGQNMQIISIEQKPEVFSDCECIGYSFSLENGVTVVRRDV